MSETMTENGKVEPPKPAKKKQSTLDLKFLSHGTLESKDLDFTRRFYEEFMGFEVIRPAKIALWIRLGGKQYLRRRAGDGGPQRRNAVSQP